MHSNPSWSLLPKSDLSSNWAAVVFVFLMLFVMDIISKIKCILKHCLVPVVPPIHNLKDVALKSYNQVTGSSDVLHHSSQLLVIVHIQGFNSGAQELHCCLHITVYSAAGSRQRSCAANAVPSSSSASDFWQTVTNSNSNMCERAALQN